MDSKNSWKVQGSIAILLILFIFFIPIPKIGCLVLIWIVLILLVNILSGCWIFSFFISTTFVILLFCFLIYESKKQKIEFRKAFIENFADTQEAMNNAVKQPQVNLPISVDDPIVKKEVNKTADPQSTKPMQQVEQVQQPSNTNVNNSTMPMNNVIIDNQPTSLQQGTQPILSPQDKPNIQEVAALKATIPKLPKISMMDNSDNESDVFGKLDTGEFEDSDEDSDDDEGTLEKKAGKTTVSSKQAYKAQKQLYDLSTAVSKLHDNMEKLAPSLKKGQKIIESMEKMGIKLV